MNWGEVIFFLLTLASVFVLVVIVFVLRSVKPAKNEKAARKQDQSGSGG
ncbi:MAG: hypothetical protein QGG67_10845 [Gammaproteobacteria bacterium]|jgi:uncharacterized protein YpmS|nr:hypothetical protein [Gammaproteobacteria bacterium]MDP6096462.1 hypothetical protein [Gammaproteobacteria bacterium]